MCLCTPMMLSKLKSIISHHVRGKRLDQRQRLPGGGMSLYSAIHISIEPYRSFLYEGEGDWDPEKYALSLLVEQKMVLQEHQSRQRHFHDRDRRHRKKKRRPVLWSEFAQNENK
mmetsp:Transcript_31040/g.53057  ORF Transcript_31040/g.53057 Transcript_31040/m.53057 type:complete len:114 (-) Transcript_31040:313-654(-)